MRLKGHSNKYGIDFEYFADDAYIGRQMVDDNCEPTESDLYMAVMQPDSVVFDCGANIGFYSILANLKIDRTRGRVFAFEPQSDNFDLLTRNVELNEAFSVTPVHAAVGNEAGTQRLYLCKRDGVVLNHGDHRLWRQDENELTEFEDVEVIKPDDFAKSNGFPTIVKMDCQGWEPLIIAGSIDVLSKNVILFAEFSPGAYAFVGSSEEEYLATLIGLFPHIFIIDDVTRRAILVTDLNTITSYCKVRQHTHANLVCFKANPDFSWFNPKGFIVPRYA